MLQHELAPGVAMTFGYFRTWYGNLRVTANQALTPADFQSYCIPGPTDPRLVGGGGETICGLFDVVPSKFGQSRQVVELASNYGSWTEVYNGFDLTLTARIRGLLVTGGMNTGSTEENYCDVVADNPQVVPGVATTATAGTVAFNSPRIESFCNTVTPWNAQTQVKAAAVYALPWQVQASVSFQHFPGITQSANIVANNALISPSLGRNLSAGPTATVVVNVQPTQLAWEERTNQTDVRFIKAMRVSGLRLQGIFDIYNAFNARPVLALNSRYSGTTGGAWLTPTATLIGRLIKFGVQVDF
jgi:hypothetical protein